MLRAMARRTSPGVRGLPYYRAHFLDSLRDDGAVCLECGKLRKTLGTHMLRTHDMALDAYREKWGFNRQTAFVAADTAARLRRLALRRKLGAHGSPELLAKARAAKRRTPGPARPEARIKAAEGKQRLYASGWRGNRHVKVDDATLRTLARGGVDIKRISRKSGLSIDQTRNRLQALGFLPPRRRRWSADRARILALRRAGLWPLEIARRLRVNPQLVRKVLWLLKQQGVPIPTPARPRPNKRRRVTDARFLRAFREGHTPVEVAALLGVSCRYVIEKTVTLRRRGVIPPVPRQTKGARAALSPP